MAKKQFKTESKKVLDLIMPVVKAMGKELMKQIENFRKFLDFVRFFVHKRFLNRFFFRVDNPTALPKHGVENEFFSPRKREIPHPRG